MCFGLSMVLLPQVLGQADLLQASDRPKFACAPGILDNVSQERALAATEEDPLGTSRLQRQIEVAIGRSWQPERKMNEDGRAIPNTGRAANQEMVASHPPHSNSMQFSAIGNPFLFNGRQYDPESNTYHYRTRYQEPASGRFISRDSATTSVEDGSLGNEVAYVENNPATYADPLGQSPGPGIGLFRAFMQRREEQKRIEQRKAEQFASALKVGYALMGDNVRVSKLTKEEREIRDAMRNLENASHSGSKGKDEKLEAAKEALKKAVEAKKKADEEAKKAKDYPTKKG